MDYASLGNYEAIQESFRREMEQIQLAHPLSQYFSVRPVFIGNYSRLVSTPKTDAALRMFPKRIRTTVEFNKSSFPGIGDNETPWEYAYRTQRQVCMKTTTYKEYLGDIEDPFPTVSYRNGTYLSIQPPPFPEAVDAVFSSGEISVSAKLQRQPSEVYKQIIFETNTAQAAIKFRLTIDEDTPNASLNIKIESPNAVKQILLSEKFFQQIGVFYNIDIFIGGKLVVSMPIKVESPLFSPDPNYINFLENLVSIQEIINVS